MNIASLCKRPIVSIDAHASLREAATLMREQHVGALVVTAAEKEGRMVAEGIVTDRDLAIEVLARDLSPGAVKIGSLATRELVAVPGNRGISECLGVMREAGVRRLLVTNEMGGLAGFVSFDDLLQAVAADVTALADTVRAGIARESSDRAELAPMPPRPVFLRYGTPGMR
jgi:CBS domain-containing protein